MEMIKGHAPAALSPGNTHGTHRVGPRASTDVMVERNIFLPLLQNYTAWNVKTISELGKIWKHIVAAEL
jgi:hypothetical protein